MSSRANDAAPFGARELDGGSVFKLHGTCFLLLCLALSICVASSCKRPVAGRDVGSVVLSDLQVNPQFIRADVSIDINFKVTGTLPSSISYDIAGHKQGCTPERRGDRFHCVSSGITRQEYSQGPTLVVLEATDADGRTSVATAPVTIDFDCPRFVSLSVDPPIAEPGTHAVVTIETSEPLREPPRVTRSGRDWETAIGSGQTYSVTHDVTLADPAAFTDIVVRLTDLAGNTSLDCGADGRLTFAVDHNQPSIDPGQILVLREAPGQPSTISAEPGAFIDDVGIKVVRVLDETGTMVFASLTLAEDGSLPPMSLGIQPASRVLLEVEDLFQRKSARVAVPEIWRLRVTAGVTPDSGLRSAVRVTAAPAESRFMTDRTLDLAPDVLSEDARWARVRARVGFNKVGDLPISFEDVHNIMSGYEPTRHVIIGVGGYRGLPFGYFAPFLDSTLLLSWDDIEGEYIYGYGPSLDIDDDNVPNPRLGTNIAFDGRGCGVLFGGEILYNRENGMGRSTALSNGAFQICSTPTGFEWNGINAVNATEDFPSARDAPILWDPLNERYIIAAGADQWDVDHVLFLEQTNNEWRYTNVSPLPSNFNSRGGHIAWYDPRIEGFAIGMGSVSPIGNGEQYIMWTYINGQWIATETPPGTDYYRRNSWAYDPVREQVVIWGGDDSNQGEPRNEVMFLTATSTNNYTLANEGQAWRSALLDHPIARDWPSMVYDSDREVMVVFGGVRVADYRWVPPEIYEIVTQPAYPYLQATIDLAAPRPKGIDRLSLNLRVSGSGDADGLGSGTDRAGGVVLLLWEHTTGSWTQVGEVSMPAGSDPQPFPVEITSNPERFVQPGGLVTLTLRASNPATERVDGDLNVDLIDGTLNLRPGVELP